MPCSEALAKLLSIAGVADNNSSEAERPTEEHEDRVSARLARPCSHGPYQTSCAALPRLAAAAAAAAVALGSPGLAAWRPSLTSSSAARGCSMRAKAQQRLQHKQCASSSFGKP